MISPTARWRRPLTLPLLWGCLLLPVAPIAQAGPKVVATRGAPSSISSEYGAAVLLGVPSVAGRYAIPTGWGFEIRDAALGGDAPIGSFCTSGAANALSVDGATVYLFAGDRGIVAVDITNPASPVAIGSYSGLGGVTLGAVSPNGYGVVAASGPDLHFLARTSPATLSPLSTLHFADGRQARGIVARADSFLVVSARFSPAPRLFLTLYRLRSGAAQPETLREIQVPNRTPTGLAWRGDLAFIAAGNAGLIVADVPDSLITDTVGFGKFVRSVDANDSVVVAAAQAGTVARFRRSGPAGELLINPTFDSVPLEPFHVTLSGSRVVIATQDVDVAQEPDEVGQSLIELRDLDTVLAVPAIGGTGRTRRVAWSAGYAYVADYTGGFRIYRADDSDTSLVGVLPLGPNSSVIDVALDPPRKRAYLAAGSQGLQIVDVANPAAPTLLGSLTLPGLASAVAVVDSDLVVVGRRGTIGAGISFVNTSLPAAPTPRGQIGGGVPDPRAIAVKDTIAFIADASLGLLSVGFGNPDAPGLVGAFSGTPALDLDLSGDLLLVATAVAGLQIVDVFRPASPSLASSVATPALLGVARSGNSAVLLAGGEGALVVDIANPSAPTIRGPIGVPGVSRDAWWVGDTLLVTAGFALERYRVSPIATTVPVLTIEFDAGLVAPQATIGWSPVVLPGMAGLNLYRDVVATPPGTSDPQGARINASLLSPSAVGAVDTTLAAGTPYRYRLEAFFVDGSARKVAEGSLYVPSTPAVGRAYPNPYRPRNGAVLNVPFRVTSGGSGGSIEVTIHDAMGRLVLHSTAPAPAAGGFGNVTWNGRDGRGRPVTDGVYFVRLRGQGIDDARQIVLLR